MASSAAPVLEDRAVVITGAGRGLGRAFALACAQAGASVVVNDIDLPEAELVAGEIREGGGIAVASGASVADWEEAGGLIELCVGEFGTIDGLVNNAVNYTFFGLPWEERPEQVAAAVQTNLVGTINCGIHAMREMVSRRCGSIVNLSSRAMMGMPGSGTYGATKGATASAALGWALELMPYGVRANALAPMALTRGSAIAGSYGLPGKTGDASPELVAPAVVYLLSDLAHDISGQILLMLSNRLGLIRVASVERIERRERWTAEELAAVFDELYRPQLQPIGARSERYEWAPNA
jgi:NAD(P)-dependent dehydrogenase (short-subunit alcohol dehydrogenase family)